MNDFDDEASTGGGYERSIVRPLLAQDGIARRIVLRFRGRPVERVSVVLEEIRQGQLGALIRYDDAHGQFHRHAPGWPEPSEHIEAFLDVPVRLRATFADTEIRARYTFWETTVFGKQGEEPA